LPETTDMLFVKPRRAISALASSMVANEAASLRHATSPFGPS